MELKPLLELKSNHYLELNLYYTSLSKAVKTGQDKLFCQEVRGNVDLLNSILEHDLVLIKTLKTFTDSDYLNFATHLEENSFSPLFSSLSHRELCDQSRQEDILGLALSLEYHVMNIDYLYMSNLLFMGSINSI
jgi:hypothetical protein